MASSVVFRRPSRLKVRVKEGESEGFQLASLVINEPAPLLIFKVLFGINQCFALLLCLRPRSGELRTQKLKSHLVRTQSLNVLPLKPGVSVYSHTCYAYCQGFIPCLFLSFRSIHQHFFQNLSRFLLCWLWLTYGSCVGPQNKTGHPAGGRIPC